MRKICAILFVVVFTLGCTEQLPITEVVIPGHGNQVYTFSNDIRQSLLVKTNDPEGIKAVGRGLVTLNIVFDGSSTEDNAYFRAVLISMLAKLPVYYSYEGRLVYFDTYYFIGNQWYNSTNEEIAQPVFSEPVLWLSGPSTGATDTSVALSNNIIYMNGNSYKGLTLAGDKLVLLFFGIDTVPE